MYTYWSCTGNIGAHDTESNGDDAKGLIGDWSIRVFWEHRRVALFDIKFGRFF